MARLLAPARRFSVRDRRILTLMAIAQFVVSYSGGLISHALPFVRNSLTITEGEMSLLLAVTRLLSLLAISFALYGDRYGRRSPFLAAFLMIPLANLATAIFPGIVLFTALQSVTRIGVVAAMALAIVLLAEELTPELRGYGIGVWALAGALGNGTSLWLLPIAERGPSSWRFLFALSALGLFVFPLLYRFLRESQAFTHPEYHVPLSAVVREGHGQYLWTLAALVLLLTAFTTVGIGFGLERLINDLEWSASSARLLVIAASAPGTLGLLIGGRLADVVGRRPTEVFALILGLSGGLLFYFTDTGLMMGVGLFAGMFGATSLTPALAAHRSELFPTRLRATAGAWISNAAIIGSVIGLGVGAVAIDTIGLPATVALLGVGVIIAALLVLPLPETKGRDLNAPFGPDGARVPPV